MLKIEFIGSDVLSYGTKIDMEDSPCRSLNRCFCVHRFIILSTIYSGDIAHN